MYCGIKDSAVVVKMFLMTWERLLWAQDTPGCRAGSKQVAPASPLSYLFLVSVFSAETQPPIPVSSGFAQPPFKVSGLLTSHASLSSILVPAWLGCCRTPLL